MRCASNARNGAAWSFEIEQRLNYRWHRGTALDTSELIAP
jgi:hypothetical protein